MASETLDGTLEYDADRGEVVDALASSAIADTVPGQLAFDVDSNKDQLALDF